MRIKFWLGLVLTSLAFFFIAFTLLYPRAEIVSATTHLADGTQVTLTAKVAERGWVGDPNGFSLKLITQAVGFAATLEHVGARLEMGDIDLTPSGTVERGLNPGDSAAFTWQARTSRPSVTSGVLWLYQINTDGSEYALFAKQFSFSAANYAGLDPLWVRIGVGLALIIGALLLWSDGRKQKINSFKKS
jgi:hypothetical protein